MLFHGDVSMIVNKHGVAFSGKEISKSSAYSANPRTLAFKGTNRREIKNRLKLL